MMTPPELVATGRLSLASSSADLKRNSSEKTMCLAPGGVSLRLHSTYQKQPSKYGFRIGEWNQKGVAWHWGWNLFKLFVPQDTYLLMDTSVRVICIMVFIMYLGRHIHPSVAPCGPTESTSCTVTHIITRFQYPLQAPAPDQATDHQQPRLTVHMSGKLTNRRLKRTYAVNIMINIGECSEVMKWVRCFIEWKEPFLLSHTKSSIIVVTVER